MITQAKIDKAIALLQKAEKLALKYSEDGFYLAFSGGKDSQCIYHLAKMAGVKFKAHYNVTTIDHPELMRFIKKQYPDVIWERPKKTFFQLCREKKILPTAKIRYCCKELKEGEGEGMVNITGVRRAESVKRSKRNSVEISGHKFSGTIDQFNAAFHANENGTFHQCINGKDKIIINPIIDWTDSDVWSFIKNYLKIPYCELYDNGYHRLGCLMCPMAATKNKVKMAKDYPNIVNAWKKTITYIKSSRNENFGVWSLSVDEIYEYLIMNRRSLKFYLANKKQLKLDL